jgi:hypothetical protein
MEHWEGNDANVVEKSLRRESCIEWGARLRVRRRDLWCSTSLAALVGRWRAARYVGTEVVNPAKTRQRLCVAVPVCLAAYGGPTRSPPCAESSRRPRRAPAARARARWITSSAPFSTVPLIERASLTRLDVDRRSAPSSTAYGSGGAGREVLRSQMARVTTTVSYSLRSKQGSVTTFRVSR